LPGIAGWMTVEWPNIGPMYFATKPHAVVMYDCFHSSQ